MMSDKPQVPAPLEPDQMVGRYRIDRLLGRGSVAEVYRAVEVNQALAQGTAPEVALKILHVTTADVNAAARRFKAQMAQIAALRHPNIVPIVDFGVADGIFYIAMQLIEGPSLRDVLSERRDGLPAARALEIFQPVAEAVAYAHRQGVIHHSVRPANILMFEGVRPILADFGIMHLLGDDDLTTAEVSPRAPIYMAPEQASGQAITPRADIYALGILLYEMLTGDVPFKGGSAARVLVQHLQEPPRPPSEINANLEPRLERVILKALEKDPAERFTSARFMIEAMSVSSGVDEYDTVTLTKSEAKNFRAELLEAQAQFEQVRTQALPEDDELDDPTEPAAPPLAGPSAGVELEKNAATGPDWRVLALGGIAILLLVIVVLGILIAQGMQ